MIFNSKFLSNEFECLPVSNYLPLNENIANLKSLSNTPARVVPYLSLHF